MNAAVLLSSLLLLTAYAFAPQQQGRPAMPQPQTPSFQSDRVTVKQDVTYASVNGSDLHLDAYEPAEVGADRRPAVILIHGGAWTSFDKSTMRGMGEFLARFGFVAFAVDYRLFDGKGNRWPAQLDDVQHAVRWIRANAGSYGVNPDRIGAFGHSAGAQLAALLGMEDTRDNSSPALAKYSSRVQAVVDVSGPTDFTTDRDPDRDAFFTAFLGASYSEKAELWRDASPVFHIAKSNAPFLIVHGTRDHDIPISQAQELFDKLHAEHVHVSLVKVDDEHTFQSQENRRRLAEETRDFFDRYLGPR